jgi:hypothetical protein
MRPRRGLEFSGLLTCSPSLDRPGPELPGCLAQVAEAADEPLMSEIGGLLPIALWGRTVL